MHICTQYFEATPFAWIAASVGHGIKAISPRCFGSDLWLISIVSFGVIFLLITINNDAEVKSICMVITPGIEAFWLWVGNVPMSTGKHHTFVSRGKKEVLYHPGWWLHWFCTKNRLNGFANDQRQSRWVFNPNSGTFFCKWNVKSTFVLKDGLGPLSLGVKTGLCQNTCFTDVKTPVKCLS